MKMQQKRTKLEELRDFIRTQKQKGVILAVSGGIDSSTLAAITHNVIQDRAVAVTVLSPIYPRMEEEEVKHIINEIGIKHYFIETNELELENFVSNPVNRCYYCKKHLLKELQSFANRLGFQIIFEGTTKSDLSGHRPGYNAIKEIENVVSPWVKFGFKKNEIRSIAKSLHLPVYEKPPSACLASRIPFGQKITRERLKRVEKAEEFIKEFLNVKQVRVRDHNKIARIEVVKEKRKKFFDTKVMDKVGKKLRSLGFDFVTLDMQGYQQGSMLRTV